MADLDKKTGAAPVEQSKDSDDILDSPYDGNPEAKDKSINELKERKLERGQELYTGFGFGGVDAEGVDIDRLGADEQAVLAGKEKDSVAKDNDRLAVKTINKEDNMVFEPATGGAIDEKTTVNVGENIEKNIEISNQANIAPNEVASYREVPKDTRIEIKADKGDVVYREAELDYEPVGRAIYVEDDVEFDHDRAFDLPINVESVNDTSADYQLNGVYYGNDYREHRNYLAAPYQRDAYSIKNHYKSRAKYTKKGLPLGKIALGAVAVAGVLWLVKDDEKDGFFN